MALLPVLFVLWSALESTVAATTVNSIAALRTAISDNTIPRILVAAGTYAFTDRMPGCLRSALCINRTVTIEAVSHGTVVFDAQAGGRCDHFGDGAHMRVIHVRLGSSDVVELIGMAVTGGREWTQKDFDRCLTPI